MIRAEVTFADGREPIDVPLDHYITLPDSETDGVVRFYAVCDHCAVQHELRTFAELVAANITEATCPAKGLQ